MMDDLISRQAAIKATLKESNTDGAYGYMDTKSIVELLNKLPSAQPTHNNESNVLESLDCVRRQDAINLLKKWSGGYEYIETETESAINDFQDLPSVRPTLYGYSIYHLAMIAAVMQKKNVTPEKAIEIFQDIARMVQMIMDEQKEMIEKEVEKWTT